MKQGGGLTCSGGQTGRRHTRTIARSGSSSDSPSLRVGWNFHHGVFTVYYEPTASISQWMRSDFVSWVVVQFPHLIDNSLRWFKCSATRTENQPPPVKARLNVSGVFWRAGGRLRFLPALPSPFCLPGFLSTQYLPGPCSRAHSLVDGSSRLRQN